MEPASQMGMTMNETNFNREEESKNTEFIPTTQNIMHPYSRKRNINEKGRDDDSKTFKIRANPRTVKIKSTRDANWQ